jgi:deoxyribodipyrimidine photolyase-related protein
MRNLVLILGDQLDANSAALAGFDPTVDRVWMAEVAEESTHVWSHKARIAIFLTAMRHYRDALKAKKIPVTYVQLDDPKNTGSFAGEVGRAIKTFKPQRLIVVEPGEYRVRDTLNTVASAHKLPIDFRTDTHFYSTIDDFRHHAAGRKQLRLEFWYRELRKKVGVLMNGDEPVGGDWNFDSDNRGSFGKSGPGLIPPPMAFNADKTTQTVLKLVNERFADHPGILDDFDWPVTPADARLALDDFVRNRLPDFGQYQDAMWTNQPYLYHSRLSAAMNLKLLDPRDVVTAAEAAYRDGSAPLAAVEGFIRQILGWREYVRGIYGTFMPEYLERNALHAKRPLPRFYWTGETEMNCIRHAIGQTLRYGYAHHIQRLMVTGLFALLLGVDPKQVHEWYLAVYVDAVEWVELPNTLGMSQYADGGVMASKPYCASGKYIQRMSNYCKGCRYDPAEAVGESACPFTTLYWDFLMRHERSLTANPRTTMQIKNLNRLEPSRKTEIRMQAERISLAMV